MDPYLAWRFLRAGFTVSQVNLMIEKWSVKMFREMMCQELETREYWMSKIREHQSLANSQVFVNKTFNF